MKLIDKQVPIDVLFIAEGTYPYVHGGVSSWIHSIITAMKDLRFGIIFLGSTPDDYSGIQYKLPENVVYLEDYFIFSKGEYPLAKCIKGSEKVQRIKSLLINSQHLPEELLDINFYLCEVSFNEILYSRKTFEMIEELYVEINSDIPFIDFFWTIRNIFIPLWVMIKAIISVVEKKISIVHSPSTGYAGFLGALLKRNRGIPYIVTEHGIYTRERKIDLLNAQWINRDYIFQNLTLETLKNLWINFFINLGKVCYDKADKVFCLFDEAKAAQISLGCSSEKIEVIPNGVEIQKYTYYRKKTIPPVIALIGRVTPIKDIKTFIKAIKLLTEKMPEAEGWIVGPEEEDPDYANECRLLTEVLDMKEKIKFLGFRELEDILPQIGLCTLTSISEGMPLVVLESFAAGVPCVTTDVGSCKQLIYGGLNKEDINLGKAGEVVKVGDSKALSEAYYTLLTDKQQYLKAQQVAIERVEKFYSFERFINSYRNIYYSFIK